MVVGVDPRPEVREPFENAAVGFLQERGVQATPSYTRLSLDQLQGDKDQIRQNLLAAGAPAVLFVRVTDRMDFVQGAPASLGSVDMGAVGESRYNALTAAGGEVDTRFGIGARVYRVSDGAFIWSALLNKVLKEDADSLVFMQQTAKTLVTRLAKDKVVP